MCSAKNAAVVSIAVNAAQKKLRFLIIFEHLPRH